MTRKPSASNTGHTTDVGSLTPHSGDYVTSANGEEVATLDISGGLNIIHDDVTVTDCRVQGISPGGGGAFGCVVDGKDAFIENTEFTWSFRVRGLRALFEWCYFPTFYPSQFDAIHSSGGTVRSSYFDNRGGVRCYSDVTVRDNAFNHSTLLLEAILFSSLGQQSPHQQIEGKIIGNWFDAAERYIKTTVSNTSLGTGAVNLEVNYNTIGATANGGNDWEHSGSGGKPTFTQLGNEDSGGSLYTWNVASV